MKTLKYSLIAVLALAGSACTNLDEQIKDNFTDKVPDYDIGKGTNVNKAVPNDGLNAAFARVLNGTANHGSYFSVQEISSDEAVITQKGGDWFDGGIWLVTHKHEFSSIQGGINGAWNDIYGGIVQCNTILAATGTTVAQAAQLRTLRAYLYWRLLDLFGNVPITTQPGVAAPQATRAQVYAFVESELLAALPNLPEGKQEYGRVSKGAANALLARLYLNASVYKGSPEWQKAIDAADAVINSGVYSLSSDYAKVFSPDNVENVEHIFVAPFDESTGTGMNFAQMTLHYPSQLTYRLQEQPWNGYSTLEAFYNSYEATDKRRANNFIVGPQKDIDGNPILDLAFDKEDPDGPEINYTPKINMLAPNGSRQAGARLGKFSFKRGQAQHMDNDYPLLRYGEVLLNKAEAVARLNNNFSHPTTLTLVNQLRKRAGVSDFTSLTEGGMLAERGRELFQEALRRTDLIRFGAWGGAWWEKPAHNNTFKNLMPIPSEQLVANQSLKQNPGY
ncbi:MAG: RagB/SusD family nutrient uptake outer membrane protein [Flammeovirgaceae bacterium]